MKEKTYILGAGIAGLSAAKKLSQNNVPLVILEKEPYIGGMSSCFTYKEFTLDYGPHKIFSQMSSIIDEIKFLIGKDLLIVPKISRIRLNNRYFLFPISVKDLLFKMPFTGFLCGFSYIITNLKNFLITPDESSYEKSTISRFGKKTYKLVFGPYARKVWGNPLKLSAELGKTRVAIPSISDLICRIIFGNLDKKIINADFFYYPKDGVGEISNKLADITKKSGNDVFLNTIPVKIDVTKQNITTQKSDGVEETAPYSNVISTIPLLDLLNIIYPPPPMKVMESARSLKYRNLILFYLIINKNRLFKDSFIFYPEEKIIFNRISEQKGFSESMIPEGKTVLCVEITCSENDEIWSLDAKDIYVKIIEGLNAVNILTDEIVEEYLVKKLRHAYPVYDLDYKSNLNNILDYLDKIGNIYPIGRQGIFNYCGMADAMDMGYTVSEFILSEKQDNWKNIRDRFNHYVTVD